MTFEKEKKDFLNKIDKSKKGSIDEGIKNLVKKINYMKNYYTTSSCSGRIVLLHKISEKKQESKWLLVKHNSVNYKDIMGLLDVIPNEGDVWLRVEPAILHICCNTLIDAKKMLDSVRKVFKRAGIIAMNRKIVLEIIGTEFIDTIISKDGKIVVNDSYLKILIKEANIKLENNYKKIRKITLSF